ncbi:MAG: DUF3810 domain-containing protein [Firmicutes bacterium]|nr:DUF3810 domain-containing protein [Bacillota bacterium]
MKQSAEVKTKDSSKAWLVAVIVINALWALLAVLARRIPDFAPFYSNTVYQLLQGILSRFSNLFPFSLSEALLYALPVAFVIALVVKIAKKKSPAGLFKTATIVISSLLLIYQLNCGINYYNISFAEKEGFKGVTNDKELLTEFCEYTARKLHESSAAAKSIGSGAASGAGNANSTIKYLYGAELATEAIKAMEKLGTIYPSLDGYYPRPKGLINSRPFSNMGVTGIYSPFTIEANYNSEMTAYNLPFTACHELSHLRGFMNESEANFIAFLACINSDNQAFQRSGYLLAWTYAGNQLYKVDREAFNRLRTALPDDVKKELDENNQFWDTYETKASEMQDSVNDAYLKQHGIADGIQSYGRVVGLMLDWYNFYSRTESL